MINYKTCATDDAALVHTCDPCEEPEYGNVRSVALIKDGTVLATPPTLIEWTAAVESGDIIVIPESRGTFDGGTPKMGPGYGDIKERKLGDDYVLAIKDPAYAANSAFWAAAEGQKWNLAWRTSSQLSYVDAKVSITAKAPVAEDIESEVIWEVEAKWFSGNKPKISSASTLMTLFKCFAITEVEP